MESLIYAQKITLIFGGQATVVAFGRQSNSHPHNWSLANLEEPEATHLHTALGAYTYDNQEIFAPRPTLANGKIIGYEALNKEILLPNGKKVFRGIDADGVILPIGSSHALSSGDCATIVVHWQGDDGNPHLIAAHAARDSLLDPEFFKDAGKPRTSLSVVENIIKEIPVVCLKTASAWVGMAIGAGTHFSHPTSDVHHPQNKKRNNFILERYGVQCFDGPNYLGQYCIKEIARAQLEQQGINPKAIEVDDVDTHNDKVANNFAWHSYRRTKEPARNLVLVNFHGTNSKNVFGAF